MMIHLTFQNMLDISGINGNNINWDSQGWRRSKIFIELNLSDIALCFVCPLYLQCESIVFLE
jgi:hypothetical protein